MLGLTARLEANSIIDRLVASGETFSSGDARRLVDLIPLSPRLGLKFIGRLAARGPSTTGHAAGIGDIEVDGEQKEKHLRLNVPEFHKIGGYTVTHTLPDRD